MDIFSSNWNFNNDWIKQNKMIMKIILTLIISASFFSINAQKMKEYKLEIEVNASKETVWKAITNFKDYPKWNTVLVMKNNDSLILGNKFHVEITKPNGKLSKFKATTISKNEFQSFSATQTMIGKWFFQATHYFIIKEIDENNIIFIQKWELKGVIASMFHKQIFKELEEFNKMNGELKKMVEK